MPLIESKVCPGCQTTKGYEVTTEQFRLWHLPRGSRPFVQDIFPEMSADDRERIMTGWCPPCWDKLWEDEDDAN